MGLAKELRFPERVLIARVTRVDRLGRAPYGRTSFEFDAIDASVGEADIERVISDPGEISQFALVRVVTTENRFVECFHFVPKDEMWVELRIRPRDARPGPIAFHSQLEETGYVRHTRGVLDGARILSMSGEMPVPPKAVGAAVAKTTRRAAAVIAQCQFPATASTSSHRVGEVLDVLEEVVKVHVRDVGQASFATLVSAAGTTLAHFDVGWPISFNDHTAPANLPVIAGSAPVILSHWDWDHLHAYHKCVALQQTRWLTPVQQLGPGASKVAKRLASADLLTGYNGLGTAFRCGFLASFNGPGTLNDTGLALILKLRSGKVALLIGDATYERLGVNWAHMTFDLLIVTHHGADFTGSAVSPTSSGAPAIMSVGYRNKYQHPRASAMRKHRSKGWCLARTCKHGSVGRGDRELGP